MGKSKQETSKNLATTATAIILILVCDKVMDTIVAVFTNDGIKREEVLPLLISLCCVALVVWALQKGVLGIFSKLVRFFKETDKFNSMENDLRTARKTIKQSLDYLKSQKYTFDKHVDYSTNMVKSLNPSDMNFNDHKYQAAQTVDRLKDDYHQNIVAVQESIDRLYENITRAEEILADADEWASKAAPKHFRRPIDPRSK